MNLPVILGAARRFGGLAVSSGFGFGFRIACCGMGKNSDLCKPGKNSVLCNLGRVRELDKCVGSTAVAEHLDAFGTLVRDGYEPRTATWAGRVMVELKSNFEQAVQEFRVHGCCVEKNLEGGESFEREENTIIKQ